ncbi:TNF receptor-associated factor 3-like [Sycon ciliatum]|uniref:TNF receptor-associated factor 3-like n=1 Tax=Sycon ciliatum TaxID=27933 RepID=UPI0020A99D4E|eukprot:scpid52457/ scgid9813/ TNF receptor-associated factor 5
MDEPDGAAASSPHFALMDGVGPVKRRRPMQSSGEIRRVVRGGYDATFALSSGPDAKHMCTICSKVLRQPMQTKCGHRVCASCVNPLMGGGTFLCPDSGCASELSEGDLFRDTFAEREILALEVVCSAITDGCQWSGTLRELEDHLEECPYILVPCGQNSCTELVQRRYLLTHRQEKCQFRFVNCSHCGTPIVLHSMPEHQYQCREWPMDCPQGCGMTALPKSLVDEHLDKECVLTVTSCKFAFVDCTFKGNRRDMEEHLRTDSSYHLVQLANLCHVQQRQLSERSKEVTALQTQLNYVVEHMRMPGAKAAASSSADPPSASGSKSGLASLFSRRDSSPSRSSPSDLLKTTQDRVNSLEQRLYSLESSQSCNGVLIWKLEEFSKHRRAAIKGTMRHITSAPFYTSPHGYKLCARVYLNGDGLGEGSFVSLYTVVMRGEYDSVLRWPFGARVTLTLLDQGTAQRHHHEKFVPDGRQSSFGRPVGEANVASGCPKFFKLSGLEHYDYVRDDTIVFRIRVDTSSIVSVDTPTFA